MATSRRIVPVLAALVVVGVVAAAVVIRQRSDDSSEPFGPPSEDVAWARGLVDAWEVEARQPFVGVGEWEFTETGRWTDIDGADRPYARALDMHLVTTRTTLPDEPPAGTVRWDDGRTGRAVALGARSALARMRATGVRCSNCPPGEFDGVKLRPLTITAATPATMRVRSSRGWATIPAWRYSFAERPGIHALQAAVRSDVPLEIRRTRQSPLSLRVERARLAPDGRTLTATFVGASAGGGACGEAYTGYAVQSGHTVGILVVRASRHEGSKGDVMCTAEGHDRSVTVTLDAPLADRVVIETVQGRPVMVER